MIRADKIVYSNRKTLAVCIDNFGNVIVRAPRRIDEKRISAFLQEKEGWIRKKQVIRKNSGMTLPPENLDGYTFSLLGKGCTLRLYEGRKIVFDGENGRLFLPRTNARARLVKWLKENGKRIFLDVTQRWATRMGVSFASVGISSAKTRWGTCTADNKIRYTFRLLYMPKEVIEYVVVHELAHVRHKNHSAAFWQEVANYVPDWKEKRKFLKAHGCYMEIF